MKIHISDGNKKLGTVPNFSLPPITTCHNNEYCKEKCYALKAWRQYPNTRKAWDENYALARDHILTFYTDAKDWINKKRPKYFRIHVAGDFLDQVYLDGWKSIALDNPQTQFLAFTKAWNLDLLRGTPDNMKIVISVFEGQKVSDIPKKYDKLPRFYAGKCHGKRYQMALKCAGKCEQCTTCFTQNVDVKTEIH